MAAVRLNSDYGHTFFDFLNEVPPENVCQLDINCSEVRGLLYVRSKDIFRHFSLKARRYVIDTYEYLLVTGRYETEFDRVIPKHLDLYVPDKYQFIYDFVIRLTDAPPKLSRDFSDVVWESGLVQKDYLSPYKYLP